MKKTVFAVMMVIAMLVVFVATCVISTGRTEEEDLSRYWSDERCVIDQVGDNGVYTSLIKIGDVYVGYATVIECGPKTLVFGKIDSLVPGRESWSTCKVVDTYDYEAIDDLNRECNRFICNCLDSL